MAMLYLSNGKVAWRIPDEVEDFYKTGVYVPSDGWSVVSHVDGWLLGKHGEMRKPRKYKARKARKKGGDSNDREVRNA